MWEEKPFRAKTIWTEAKLYSSRGWLEKARPATIRAAFPGPDWKQQFIGHLEAGLIAPILLPGASFAGSCSCIIPQSCAARAVL